MASPKVVAIWTAPHHQPMSVHEIVERVLSKYYPHMTHDICPNCNECISCDNPHYCAMSMAKAA